MNLFKLILLFVFFFNRFGFDVNAQNWSWANSSSSTFYEAVNSVAVDEVNSAMYAVGILESGGVFSDIPAGDIQGGTDGFVAKYDPNGNIEWAFNIGGNGDDQVTGITVDPSNGNIFITGYVFGTYLTNNTSLAGHIAGAPWAVIDPGGNGIGGKDCFIACYSSAGALIWYRIGGGVGDDRGLDIAINSIAVYITGFYTNQAGFGTQTSSIASNSTRNNMVVAYDKTSGNELWMADLGSENNDFDISYNHQTRDCGITADNNGVYTINYFMGTSYQIYDATGGLVASIPDINTSTEDFVVASFSPAGNFAWATLYDNFNDSVAGLDITQDCQGVYIVGSLHNASVTPGGTTITSVHDNGILAKLDKAGGAEMWVRQIVSELDHGDYLLGIEADGYGGVHAIGRMGGYEISIETPTPVHTEIGVNGYSETFILHYLSDGTFKSFERIPGGADGWGTDICAFQNTNSFVGGYYNNTITFNPYSLPPNNNNHFVAKKILPPVFYYTSTSYCQGDVDPAAIINMPGLGFITAPPGIVFTDISTGLIDLSASTVGGPYTIEYTSSVASCFASITATFDVSILAEQDPVFNYPASSYCQGDANPIPSTATPSGTFSGPLQVVFANATTGEIDLAASTPGGPYSITYITPGPDCVNSANFTLSIFPEDDASFNYASMSFCQGDANPIATGIQSPGSFTGPPGIVFVSTITGEISLTASVVGGPYDITYTTSGSSCTNSSMIQIMINPEDDPSFIFGSSNYCQGDPNPSASSIATPNGTFTGPAQIVFANATTGEIDLVSSIPGGPYTITYTTPGLICPNTQDYILSITGEDDATFSYAQNVFCQSEPNPSATGIVTSLGLFSGPAEVVFIDDMTGEINLAASTSGGPYTIIYTTNGPCPNSETFNIWINEDEDASFSYGAAEYCQGDPNPVAVGFFTPFGTFSGPLSLIFADAASGQIDLSATPPGTYPVTYTTPGPFCTDSYTFYVTINEVQDASFFYDSDSYCKSDVNPDASGIVTPFGTFTGPAQIDFVNTITGKINLATSMAGGPFTITYTTPGPQCPGSSTFDIFIDEPPTADAGPDQFLNFTFETDLAAVIPTIGIGVWILDTAIAILENENDPFSKISGLPVGQTGLEWQVTNGSCLSVSDRIVIEVSDLWIPQGITPNFDGENDYFALKNIDNVLCEVEIFNRWGQAVYTNSDYQNDWAGTNMSGQILQSDTYFYIIQINDDIVYKGYLVLKR